jgi:ubiquinone/menaquinone biosynthesis C-methylase UbiE
MGLYSKYILPRLVTLTCGMKSNMRQREKVIPLAKGRVLEVGIGSGLNLQFYNEKYVEHIWGLDPSIEMWAMATKRKTNLQFGLEFLEATAESIPLDTECVDTIVVTYTLCTVPDVVTALRQMRRVLRSGGELIFCEHGAAPDTDVRKWQERLNPVWNKLGGGCNLNRHIPSLLEEGGFKIRKMNARFIPGWKPASFNFWGTASKAD